MDKIKIKVSAVGRFKLETYKKGDPSSRKVVAEFENMILNNGLNLMAYDAVVAFNYVQVGSGNTPPAAGQVALVSRVASTSSRGDPVQTWADAPPYFSGWTAKYTFGEGVAAGVLAEIGVGRDSNGNLFCRSLIKDSGGTPTTITVLSDEYLDVTYEAKFFVEGDVTGSITADGSTGGTYSYTLRPANVQKRSYGDGFMFPDNMAQVGSVASVNLYDGAIGPATGAPAGAVVQLGRNAASVAGYVTDSFKADWTINVTPAQGNTLGGSVRSFLFRLGVATYQIEFNPPIPKSPTSGIKLYLQTSWGRRA